MTVSVHVCTHVEVYQCACTGGCMGMSMCICVCVHVYECCVHVGVGMCQFAPMHGCVHVHEYLYMHGVLHV